MKRRFIRRFIITEETCTIGVPSAKREGVYTGRQYKGEGGAFILTRRRASIQTCIDALALRARDVYSTGFLGDNKSPYKPPFHRIRYLCHTCDEEDAVSLLGCLYCSVKLHGSFVC